MKLLYKPLSLITGKVASKLGKATFHGLWSKLDDREPPKPTAADAGIGKVLQAAILEAATMAAFAALADRAAAHAFRHLFGSWPGEKRDETR